MRSASACIESELGEAASRSRWLISPRSDPAAIDDGQVADAVLAHRAPRAAEEVSRTDRDHVPRHQLADGERAAAFDRRFWALRPHSEVVRELVGRRPQCRREPIDVRDQRRVGRGRDRELPGIAQDGEAEADAGRERHDGVQVHDLLTEERARLARSRHVGAHRVGDRPELHHTREQRRQRRWHGAGDSEREVERTALPRFLGGAHLGRDQVQALARVGDVERERHEHARHAVPERQVLVVATHVHGDQRPRPPTGCGGLGGQEAPQTAGDDGQCDVVHLAACRASHGEEFVELERRPHDPAGVPDGPVEREGTQAFAHQIERRAGGRRGGLQIGHHAAGMGDPFQRPPHAAQQILSARGERARRRDGRLGAGARLPAVGHDFQHLDPADAVDHAVVDFGEQCGAPVGEALEQVALPERTIGSQGPREDLVYDAPEGRLVGRRRDSAPDGCVGADRSRGRRASRAAKGREWTAPVLADSAAAPPRRAAEDLDQLLERRRLLQHGDGADVQPLGRPLEIEEGRIERRQPIVVTGRRGGLGLVRLHGGCHLSSSWNLPLQGSCQYPWLQPCERIPISETDSGAASQACKESDYEAASATKSLSVEDADQTTTAVQDRETPDLALEHGARGLRQRRVGRDRDHLGRHHFLHPQHCQHLPLRRRSVAERLGQCAAKHVALAHDPAELPILVEDRKMPDALGTHHVVGQR